MSARDEQFQSLAPGGEAALVIAGEIVDDPEADAIMLELDRTSETRERRGHPQGRRLSPPQQRMIARWHIEGLPYSKARERMIERWGFAVSSPTYYHYSSHRRDLLQAAQAELAERVKYGWASRDIRLERLGKLADKLQEAIEARGVYRSEVQVLGVRKTRRSATSHRGEKPELEEHEYETTTRDVFEAALVDQYRRTIEQIHKMMDPIEHLAQNVQNQVVITPDMALKLAAAQNWKREQNEQAEKQEKPT